MATKFARLLGFFALVWGSSFAAAAPLASNVLTTAAAVNEMHVADTDSLQNMASALSVLGASAKRAIDAKPPNYDLQEALVTASGEAVGRIFSLYQTSTQSADQRRQGEALFLSNRELLQSILKHNEGVVRHYQEHELDQMKNPAEFFESAAWQSPQKLISLASYWLGWNGYYASLLMQAEAPLRKSMLEESVEAFSRSFIDFQEDEITTKSLYGRGLVYKQLGIYGRAAYDFKSVKQKVGREHSLYLNCLYQEAVISHESGNDDVATALLQAIRDNYLQEDIPSAIKVGMKKLETQFILTSGHESAKPQQSAGASSTDTATPSDKRGDTLKNFQRLKAVARDDADLFGEFYGYSKEHAAELAALPYDELTPVAALAVADWYFEAKEFDSALPHYQRLMTDKPAVIKAQLDGVWLRTAYIHNQQEEWAKVARRLANFSASFPRSRYLKEAAELYYSAAVTQYRKASSQSNYQAYIMASRNYVNHCGQCARRDDAYYELGRHYTKQNKASEAVEAFAKVGRESPHYYIARYHVADAQVAALEALERQGGGGKQQAAARHKAVHRILKDYASIGVKDVSAKPLRPHWALLQARFNLLNMAPDYPAVIASLEGFESRFPKATILALKVARARVVAYQRLGQQQNLGAEINRIAQLAIKDSGYYQALQRLADEFYTESTTQAADAALILYQQLAMLSRGNTDYQDYQQAIQLRLGDIHSRYQRLPEALDIYLQLVAQDPESADALYALGHTYREMAQWQNALEIWRRLSDGLDAGSPHWYEARYQTAYSMQQLNRPGRACSIAKMTLVLHPDLGDEQLSQKFQTIERDSCEKHDSEVGSK